MPRIVSLIASSTVEALLVVTGAKFSTEVLHRDRLEFGHHGTDWEIL
jgi:hypothetical protein